MSRVRGPRGLEIFLNILFIFGHHSTPSITSVYRPMNQWISHDRGIFELRIDRYQKKSSHLRLKIQNYEEKVFSY